MTCPSFPVEAAKKQVEPPPLPFKFNSTMKIHRFHSCRLWRISVLLLALSLPLAARTWTSSDGRTLDGDFVSATDTAVTVKKKDGKRVTIELTKLSAEDQEFVKTQKALPAPEKKTVEPPAGPSTAITGPCESRENTSWTTLAIKCELQGML